MSNSSDHCWDNNNLYASPPSCFLVPDPTTINIPSESMSSSVTDINNNNNAQLTPRSSSCCGSKPIRRRSRASKKTPTTLLTANTSNFRELVQQFTGCPKKAIAFGDNGYKGPINLDFQQSSVQNPDGVHSYQQQYHDQRQQFVEYIASTGHPVPLQQQQQDYTVSLFDNYVGSGSDANGFELQLDYPGNDIDPGVSFPEENNYFEGQIPGGRFSYGR